MQQHLQHVDHNIEHDDSIDEQHLTLQDARATTSELADKRLGGSQVAQNAAAGRAVKKPPLPAQKGAAKTPIPVKGMPVPTHVFTYEDDDADLPVDMVASMFESIPVRMVKTPPRRKPNGGFTKVDQELCMEIARRAPPPLD